MTVLENAEIDSEYHAGRVGESDRRLKFGKDEGFHADLRQRVDEYFRRTGLSERDCPRMYLKTAVILGTLIGSYLLLVFVVQAWWQALPLAMILGIAMAGVGFSIQHDGGHQAYSNRRWVNKLMSLSLDVVGGSSYVWHWQHAVIHHTFVNITEHDADIDLGAIGRLSPHQKWHSFHRWQHLYIWPFYGLMAVSWHLIGDFRDVITGRIKGGPRFPRPRGKDLAVFIAGKAVFLSLAFGLPLVYHPAWVVASVYGVAASTLGIILSVVFQMAHCVVGADFPLPPEDSEHMGNTWAIHQVETTVDFARDSRLVSWLLGGLNFQVEHHLFPRICHIHYPELSKVVEETCREYGVRYMEYPTFWSGFASHYHWLRQMGMPNEPARA